MSEIMNVKEKKCALLESAHTRRNFGTVSGVAGIVGGLAAGLALPAAGVAVGLTGAVVAAGLLFNAESKEKLAKSLHYKK